MSSSRGRDTRARAAARSPGGGGRIVDLGGKTYGWLRDTLRVYGTFVTLVQLLPALLALAAVLLSPTAWLSATLRRWVLAGSLLGTVVGMVVLARRAGLIGSWRLAEVPTTRAGEPEEQRVEPLASLAWWGLGTALLAAVVLRVHLATVDVGFVDRYRFLTPLFDYYLSGGRASAIVFNGLAGLLSAALVGGLVAGAPAALLRWRRVRRAELSLVEEGGPLAALAGTVEALDEAKQTLTLFQREFVELKRERDDLASRLELALAELQAVTASSDSNDALTNEADRPAPRAPRAASDRPRR